MRPMSTPRSPQYPPNFRVDSQHHAWLSWRPIHARSGARIAPPISDFMPECIANIASVDLGPGITAPAKHLPLRHLGLSSFRKHLHLAPNAFPALIAAPSCLPNARQKGNRLRPGFFAYETGCHDGGNVKHTRFSA